MSGKEILELLEKFPKTFFCSKFFSWRRCFKNKNQNLQNLENLEKKKKKLKLIFAR